MRRQLSKTRVLEHERHETFRALHVGAIGLAEPGAERGFFNPDAAHEGQADRHYDDQDADPVAYIQGV